MRARSGSSFVSSIPINMEGFCHDNLTADELFGMKTYLNSVLRRLKKGGWKLGESDERQLKRLMVAINCGLPVEGRMNSYEDFYAGQELCDMLIRSDDVISDDLKSVMFKYGTACEDDWW